MGMDLWPGKITGKKATSLYGKTATNNEINLRDEFRDLIDGNACEPQRGHWVLLRRMATKQRCSCWNKVGEGNAKYKYDHRKYDEPDKDCDVCGGEGWLYNEELHNVRRRITTPPTWQAGIEQQTEFAIMNVPYVIYYFKYYVNPADLDRILEIDNDEDGNPVRPFVRNEIYNITLAEPFRDLNGRIEYWRCAAKKEELRYGRTL
jgi:hypothetical protein